MSTSTVDRLVLKRIASHHEDARRQVAQILDRQFRTNLSSAARIWRELDHRNRQVVRRNLHGDAATLLDQIEQMSAG